MESPTRTWACIILCRRRAGTRKTSVPPKASFRNSITDSAFTFFTRHDVGVSVWNPSANNALMLVVLVFHRIAPSLTSLGLYRYRMKSCFKPRLEFRARANRTLRSDLQAAGAKLFIHTQTGCRTTAIRPAPSAPGSRRQLLNSGPLSPWILPCRSR